MFHKRALQCAGARMGIISNNGELIREYRYFNDTVMESILTNVHRLVEIPFEEGRDADFIVVDDPQVNPRVEINEKTCFCAGDFSRWEKTCADNRYSLFGNLGLFFRYTMATLERFHNIYSFHASSMYIPSNNTILLIVGGAGAGKTIYLLEAIMSGWKILSTEMTHFRFTDTGYEVIKGALFDNIRVGNLVYDFPEVPNKLGIQVPQVEDVWGHKIALDLTSLQAEDVYVNPRLQIINAHIESHRPTANVTVMKKKDKVVWTLYQNASEKLSPPWLMYEQMPVAGCDDPPLAWKRLETMRRIVDEVDMLPVKSIVAGAKNCLEGIET
ncbi:MAG: hypothetical protein JRI22_02365 [Deltaproteobacteria bacterium]|nr:hypothetical protein [Deltaproteobacteria bacterium]